MSAETPAAGAAMERVELTAADIAQRRVTRAFAFQYEEQGPTLRFGDLDGIVFEDGVDDCLAANLVLWLNRMLASDREAQSFLAPSAGAGAVAGPRFIDQTRTRDTHPDVRGDCTRAAIASLFALPLDEVPDFDADDPVAFYESVEAFFLSLGFEMLRLDGDVALDALHLANGPAARGIPHTVVRRESALVHDPHPSRTGLDGVDFVVVPVPLDPSRLLPAQVYRERLQAIVDWANLAHSASREFADHGLGLLRGPVFDKAREVLATPPREPDAPTTWSLYQLPKPSFVQHRQPDNAWVCQSTDTGRIVETKRDGMFVGIPVYQRAGRELPHVPDEPSEPDAELNDLREEVGYWRRDAAARIWFAKDLIQAGRKEGQDDLAFAHRDALRAAVTASEAVQAKHWHLSCELCGKPMLPGEATYYFSEEGISAHDRCAFEGAADDTGAPDPTDAEWRQRTAEGRAALTADDQDPEPDAPDGVGHAGPPWGWRRVSDTPDAGGTYLFGGYVTAGGLGRRFERGFAHLIRTIDGPEWAIHDPQWQHIPIEWWTEAGGPHPEHVGTATLRRATPRDGGTVGADLRALHALTEAPAPWPQGSTPIANFEEAAIAWVRDQCSVATPMTCAHMTERGECVWHTRTWSPACTPSRCATCPDAPRARLATERGEE